MGQTPGTVGLELQPKWCSGGMRLGMRQGRMMTLKYFCRFIGRGPSLGPDPIPACPEALWSGRQLASIIVGPLWACWLRKQTREPCYSCQEQDIYCSQKGKPSGGISCPLWLANATGLHAQIQLLPQRKPCMAMNIHKYCSQTLMDVT